MDLYKIKPEFMNLIDKLELARRIYDKASERVTDEFLREQFKIFASRKIVYIKEISHLFDFDYEKHSLDLKDKIKVEWEEIGIELNNLFLKTNDQALLEYCLHRERGILKIYKDILERGTFDDLFVTVVRKQMNETVELIDELTRIKEPSRREYNK
jgi:hypothetical protein